MLNPHPTLLIKSQPPKTPFIQLTLETGSVNETIDFTCLLSVLSVYTVKKAGRFPHKGAGDTSPPRFVPGLLRAQDQCPPG